MKDDYPPRLISRLWDAVEILAVTPGSIAKRLCEAYRWHILSISPKEFPEELRYEFEDLCANFQAELAKTQGKLKLSGIPESSDFRAAECIDHRKARRMAQQTVSLCRSLAYRLENWAHNSYGTVRPIDIKRLRDAHRRREKALKANPTNFRLLDGSTYLAGLADNSNKPPRDGKKK